MSDASEIAIEAELAPGDRGRLLLALPPVIAVAALLAAGLQLRSPAMVVLLLPLGILHRAWGARAWRRWRRLCWPADGGLALETRDGVRHAGELLPRQFVSRWLVVLRVRAAGRRWDLPFLWIDEPETVRRLSQRLRAGAWRRQWPDHHPL